MPYFLHDRYGRLFVQRAASGAPYQSVVGKMRDEEIVIIPKFKRVGGSVASLRLDCILALAWQSSRSKMTPYIEGEKVFVNGRLVTSNSFGLKEGDIVSVRGLGKFIYRGVETETKRDGFLLP